MSLHRPPAVVKIPVGVLHVFLEEREGRLENSVLLDWAFSSKCVYFLSNWARTNGIWFTDKNVEAFVKLKIPKQYNQIYQTYITCI